VTSDSIRIVTAPKGRPSSLRRAEDLRRAESKSLTRPFSIAWALGNVGTNITANSISSANDLTTLFPRWINILRGQIFAVFIGVWAFAPWKVLATAGSFISFMGAYSIVLAPIGAILAADFFVVKGQKYNVPELYDPRGIYRFSYGINWRAAVALVVSIAPNMPGMIVSILSAPNPRSLLKS
jgi:nucleobase:cation symporter-1, NCS1 family